jgi:protein arginine kinase activator
MIEEGFDGIFGGDMDDEAGECGSLCDDCKIREANVHLTHVGEDGAETFHLCEECARDRGVPIPDSDILMKGLEALAGVVGASAEATNVKVTLKPAAGTGVAGEPPPEAAAKGAAEEEKDIICRNCGMKFSEFRANGRLGCAVCYECFEERVDRILVQVHGASGHKGKQYGRPSGGRRGGKAGLERLRSELDAAVRAERFEQAALLRDEIRGLGAAAGAK